MEELRPALRASSPRTLASQSSTERQVQAGFAVALTLLGVIGVVSWLSVAQLRQNSEWVAHTHEVMGGLDQLLLSITEAESAQRAYMITDDEAFLQARQAAAETERGQLDRLRSIVADNPGQQRRLAALAAMVAQRFAFFDEVAAARRAGGLEAVQGELFKTRGTQLRDDILRAVAAMKQAEQALLAQREKTVGAAVVRTNTIIIGGGVLAFAFVGFALLVIRRGFARQQAAEDGLRVAKELLEVRVEERTADLRKSTEQLRDNEQLLEDMGRLARVGGWEFDPISGRGRWTREVAHIHNLDPELEPSKEMGLQFYPGESRTRIETAVHEAIETGAPYDLELEFVARGGEHKWVRTICQPIMQDGRVIRMRGAIQDVTERREAQLKLQAQVQRLSLLQQITRAIGDRQDLASIFQVVVGSVQDELPLDFACVCLYHPADSALSVSSVGVRSRDLAGAMRLEEEARIEIDGNGLARCVRGELVYESDLAQVKFPFPQRLSIAGLHSMVAAPLLVEGKPFGMLISARRAKNAFTSGDCEFLRQLSEHVALAAHQAQLYGALHTAYNDLRQTQQAVMEQERLRVLGQMASGIAHDINNAISPVTLYTESLLENESGLTPRAREYLQTIRQAIGDVAETVARMREFYRKREPQLSLTPMHVNALLQQVIELTRARWSDMTQQRGVHIHLKTELASDPPAVMGIDSEIREALTNLIFNAVDAMPRGGTLTLRTKVNLPQVHVEVSDNGSGMDEETRRRCQEPFFTTKGERGTGLGLAMVYGTAQRHGAEMDIQSAVGKGTTVRLSFPVPATKEPTEAPVVYALPSSLRLLIIDDDAVLLKSLRDTLQTDGHMVVTANGGQEGINLFSAARGENSTFDVVITDLGMPNVDGRKVAGAIKTISPTTPVILLTGWGHSLAMEADLPAHVDRVLSKPPRLAELRAALAGLTTHAAP